MATARPRVLVVYKQDAYQQYLKERRDPHLVRLLKAHHPALVEMRQAHAGHIAALSSVIQTLKQLAVEFTLVARADLKVQGRYDLVVSVGGDGTFLKAARSVTRTPLLGVNSNPRYSEAVFCAATYRTFARLCRLALSGQLPELRLYRLQVVLNGKQMPSQALNDLLIAHDDPATMSRYRLAVGKREEFQKSSGLWVATAAGSSSVVLAAGGTRLPWGAATYQYRPRELYVGRLSRYRLKGGVLGAHALLRVTWLMRRGAVFIDGPHETIPLRFADQLEVQLNMRDPLRVVGLTHR